ncbi:hypothetical protein [Microbacterium sp. NIBRBAC000506063]|uniref:hypothetical protein n=1 Tax=Microbacterium sp. NIBRBAC000506063 TaxID=2734618 RepID=UPI0021D40634|nr:hypothetical protein [Microbacterium sp. NIBRBAC000506063]
MLDNLTRAEIEDGARVTGGHNVLVEALSSDVVTTEVTAGSAGGVAVSPAVGITIVQHTTIARIGTSVEGGWTVTGWVAVRAGHTGSTTTTGNATAAGEDVAVGAIIVINVVDIETRAETLRSLTAGGFVEFAASTVTASRAEAEASANGTSSEGAEDSNSDTQAQDQVDSTPATKDRGITLPKSEGEVNNANNTADAEGGQGSDGVGVGAAVTVNWMIVRTIAEIPTGLVITAGGDVRVLAENAASATAKATGIAVMNDTNIGAAVALNVSDVDNIGRIGAGVMIVSGGDVVVTALTPEGLRNDYIVWAISAAGGNGDLSIAGSVAVQVLLLRNEATIGQGVTITAVGGVRLLASNPMGLQSIAAAGGIALGGNGIGAAIVVNVIDTDTIARIHSSAENPTIIDSGGASALHADSSLRALPLSISPEADAIITLPNVTSIALAGGAGTDSFAIGGSLIVTIVNSTTHAVIDDAVRVNAVSGPVAGQSLSLRATDASEYFELAGALGLSTGSAGIGFALVLGIHNKDVLASIGAGVTVRIGGDVSLTAAAEESFIQIAAGAAAAKEAGVTGSFVVLLINQGSSAPGTRAVINGSQNTPTTVYAGGNLSLSASDHVTDSILIAGSVAAGAQQESASPPSCSCAPASSTPGSPRTPSSTRRAPQASRSPPISSPSSTSPPSPAPWAGPRVWQARPPSPCTTTPRTRTSTAASSSTGATRAPPPRRASPSPRPIG